MSQTDMMQRRLGQIAIVVSDYDRSRDFYARVFDLDYVFSSKAFTGPMPAMVQNLSTDIAAVGAHWLIDDREGFQLEIFQYENPQSKPLPSDPSISDTGYNRIIIAVKSVVDTSHRAAEAGAKVMLLSGEGDFDGPPHALLKDPDGILLEIIEMPALVSGSRTAQLVGLGLTADDIALTTEDMCDGHGFNRCEDIFDHQALWSKEGQLEKSQTLQMGDMYLVASQYQNARPRPKGYRLSDIGIMNFAILFPDAADFNACYETTKKMGMKSNCDPVILGPTTGLTYNNDRQGFSVEMVYVDRKEWGLYGFAAPRLQDRLINKIVEYKSQRNYKKLLSANN